MCGSETHGPALHAALKNLDDAFIRFSTNEMLVSQDGATFVASKN